MKNENLFYGIQSFLKSLGEEGCYCLCLLKIAERITGKELSPLVEIPKAIEKGWISYDWQNPENKENFYVWNPDVWLESLTGRKFMPVEKVKEKPAADFLVEVWKNAHFRLPDWDSLVFSHSVATGNITSWRMINFA